MKLSNLIDRLVEIQNDRDDDPPVKVFEPYSNLHEVDADIVGNNKNYIIIAPES